ncbi:hypothetical protein [Clostridium chauvoei]|uniref:ATP synthase protein I n=2 Tax=Clostridium chauvoei TaxID=46867 RepID=A0A1U6JPN5_9CLOT|nr:hypothetical protein [Clostridium chauvoei]ATD55929.1 hypothetical protein BTM20_12115 [Clostridium chauvoei]ATD56399.1 hypothetical protein BTM21_00900 [Clostridium chauvoei]MBX7281099.1 hypothetical protein [Clostridium chauvoei]MBX7283581.1 hypothetical protein [Clostridium chauvoei]MBX7286189.1 hypothetical protein [Clostridium chauvoei]
MSREMNNLLSKMIKCDLVGGIISALIVSLLVNLQIASIFFMGVLVALINFIVSGKILEYSLIRNKRLLIICSYFIKIMVIVCLALPFMYNLQKLIAYVGGYIIHFVFLTGYWLKNEKGSD